jgi:phosphoribosylglycinamide formyltransferase-1
MRLGWGVSGRGFGARAVIQAFESGLINSRMQFVLFDRPSPMQPYCEARCIPHALRDATNFNEGFIDAKEQYELDWIGLTFNRLLTQAAIDAYNGNIFNLHMALLPMFPGFGATKKALQSGLRYAGITVHLIDAGMDSGPIITQAKCNISTNDTEASLGRKQFELAVPRLIQTVRHAERGRLSTFVSIDDDIAEFSNKFCATLELPQITHG